MLLILLTEACRSQSQLWGKIESGIFVLDSISAGLNTANQQSDTTSVVISLICFVSYTVTNNLVYLNSSVAKRQIFFMDLFRRTSIVMQNYNRFRCFYHKIQRDWSDLTQDYEFKKYICYINYLQFVQFQIRNCGMFKNVQTYTVMA